MRQLPKLLLALLFAVQNAFAVNAPTPWTPENCLADLNAMPAFLLENDAGARDAIARKGQDVFDRALKTAQHDAAAADSEDKCADTLKTYLRTYRNEGHLYVSPVRSHGSTAPKNMEPSVRVLSKRTALLTLPTFENFDGPIAAIFAKHAKEIAIRPNLIIDVRGNGGGADSSYQPVLPLLMNARWRIDDTAFLATPANIANTEAICGLVTQGERQKQCEAELQPLIAVMRGAQPGSFVQRPGQSTVRIFPPLATQANPRHVAILIDEQCASACEQFVLAARQSYKTKLFGQSTFGALDYSNLRAFMLPSGHALLYATSRSFRLPAFSVDAAGIPPDQVLPKPADDAAAQAELDEVQKVLESIR